MRDLEAELHDPPFSTVPARPSAEAVDVGWTRDLALAATDWRGLANRCGIHAADMRGFLEKRMMLTAPARERIRAALNEKAPACEVPAYEIPATTRYPEGPRVGFSGYLQSDPPACPTCEAIMVRRAAEYVCLECGQRTGVDRG